MSIPLLRQSLRAEGRTGPEEFGRELARERTARGLSQRELGARVGATDVTVSNWERGVTVPAGKHLLALARELGIDAEALMVEAEEARGSTEAVEGEIVSRLRSVFEPIAVYRKRLPPKAYTLVYQYLARLEKAGLNPEEIEEAERFLVDAAYNKLNASDPKERTETDMMKDIRAAWEFVKEVLGLRVSGL